MRKQESNLFRVFVCMRCDGDDDNDSNHNGNVDDDIAVATRLYFNLTYGFYNKFLYILGLCMQHTQVTGKREKN